MAVKVRLQPLVRNINLPTVLKTATLPGDAYESLFIATQVGEIFYLRNEKLRTFLDIRNRIIELGTSNGGYDERGLLGLAFHPNFSYNGLFYLHYSVAGTQGPGAMPTRFHPDPCNLGSLSLEWQDRETQYDHIDTVEEWVLEVNGQPQFGRTILNLRRPYANHNGVNSLNFSPETGNLVLTTGDGGSGYDPFNLSQNNLEIAGKIIEIDVDMNIFINNPPVVTRFNELPTSIIETLSLIAKGVRNITGISYQKYFNQYRKYVGNVGQDLVESIYTFIYYNPIPISQIIQAATMNSKLEELINLGWRAFEGSIPTSIISNCTNNQTLNEKIIAYYNEAIETSVQKLQPLTCYYHHDPRPNKFNGTAITGVQPYAGSAIPELTGGVLFTDFSQNDGTNPSRGVLAYTRINNDCKISDYSIIETDYDFGTKSSYYVSLGTNLNQAKLYLGVYGSSFVTDFYQGTIFEIIPY